MKPFPVSIFPELSEFGAIRVLKGKLDEEGYTMGAQVFETPEGVDYDLQITNTSEGLLLSGTVHALVQGACARCLEPTQFEVTGDVEGYYLLEQAEELEGYEEDEFDCVDKEGNFDIADPILAGLVYSTPYIVLCDDDCKGLCPKCGANLNEGPCECDADDEIDPTNPFAALKNFKFDNTDE